MNDALLRASLQTVSHVEVTDPNGQLWTVHIIRRGDPRDPFVRLTNTYFPAVALNRLRRFAKRDHMWNVELMSGQLRDDRTASVVRGTEPDKDSAIEAAVRLAQQVKTGVA